MYKKGIALSFVVLFMSLLVAPSLIAAFDDSIDISVFYSLSSEEEENCNTKIASHFTFDKNECLVDISFQPDKVFGYQFKNYPKPHLNLISPPPDHFIL